MNIGFYKKKKFLTILRWSIFVAFKMVNCTDWFWILNQVHTLIKISSWHVLSCLHIIEFSLLKFCLECWHLFSWRLCVCMCSVVSNSLRPHGLSPSKLFCPWNFPGKNTGVDCHFFLQGIFPTQELNGHLFRVLHRQMDSLPLCHLGNLVKVISW